MSYPAVDDRLTTLVVREGMPFHLDVHRTIASDGAGIAQRKPSIASKAVMSKLFVYTAAVALGVAILWAALAVENSKAEADVIDVATYSAPMM